MKRVLLGCVLLLVMACGDDPSGPAYAPFDGPWRGSLSGLNVRIDVTDVDGEVTGTGRLQLGSQSVNISLDGRHDHPAVSWTGRATGYENFHFDGRFTAADTVSGRVNGSGYSNHTLILIRD